MNIPDTMVIVGWTLAAVGYSGIAAWLFYEATAAPTIEDDEESVVYGPRAMAVRQEMRAEVIAYHGIQDEVPS